MSSILIIKSKLLIVSVITAFLFIVCALDKQFPGRKVIPLSGNWNFVVDSGSKGNSEKWGEKGLPENLVRTVSVPHTWNVEKGMEKYWGKGWYERTFEVSEQQLKQATRLQFDGVNHDAMIFVNGKRVGEHLGSGYNRFFIDISPFLTEGVNRLTVCADNSPSVSNIPMLRSFDWSNDGGIYRNVYEIITNKQAIRNVHVIAEPEGQKGRAFIMVNLLNPGSTDSSKIKLKAIITEENQPTQNQIFNGSLEGKYGKGTFACSLNFDHISTWHFDSPNLYKLNVKLVIDGEEKDEYATTFGFRSIKVSNNRYILNGEPIRLMGVEWMPGSTLERGMAENHNDLEKNLNLLKNVNCIFTRFHWQQDDFVLEWCDRHGMLVQEEIPYWGATTVLNDTLLQKGIQHLDEMTDAHFNHPSLIAWGIGNELRGHDPINKASLKKLYDHAKAIDSSRLVNYVTNNLHIGFPSEGKSLPDASADFDIMMFNEYFSTWYGKSIDVVSEQLDRIAKEYQEKPLTISEWGLCEPVHKGGDPRRVKEMVRQIAIYGSKSYVAGAVYFCLNDYRTQMGEDITYSYPQRVHGVCDIKLNPKPSYDTLKFISSPVEIKKIVRNEGRISVTLRGKEGLPSYTLRNYIISAGNEKQKIDELKPGEERTFDLNARTKEFAIFRPTGYEVIKIKL
jgi:beta-galactosidase